LLMKRAFPSAPLVIYASGSLLMKDAIERNEIKDFVSQEQAIRKAIGRPVVPKNRELEAIDLAHLVIAHCDMIRLLYRYYYPFQACKIYSDVLWKTEWIYEEAARCSSFKKPFEQRDIDVVFVASSWRRPEKNFPLLKKIASSLKNLSIHIVGGTAERLPGVTHHELVTRGEEVFRLMARAKTVVCPSLCDAAPGILFEASALECNVVASKNVGNWRLCNDELLADPYTAAEFVDKIQLSLSKKFEDHIDYFLRANSYQKLIEVLSVV
jgi:glycosyltransferase involved in cell wall biosynthesis